jgi:DNA-binding MarR family transcriptional regulator
VRTLVKESAEAEGLTPVQARTLRFAARTKSFMASVGNLSLALGATHVTAVKVAAGLERRGLLERVESPWDRRVTLLRLTPAGRQALERLGRFEERLEHALAALSPHERSALEPLLGAVVRSLQLEGVLTVSEPCRGCRHFEENAAPGMSEPHRCRLLERFVSEREALLDCPDHAPAWA